MWLTLFSVQFPVRLRGGGPGGELGGERGTLLAHIGGHLVRILDRFQVRILGTEARRALSPEARCHVGEGFEERGAKRGGARTLEGKVY